MKATINSFCAVTVASLFAMAAYAQNTSAPSTSTPSTSTPSTSTPSIVGSYQCQRIDSSNTTTSYPLAIKSNGSIYTLEWENSAGFPALYGVGLMHPSMNNVLGAKFFDPKDSSIFGVEVFNLKPDGSLSANWAVQSTNQVGSETCTRSS
jgi:hypothetical protein